MTANEKIKIIHANDKNHFITYALSLQAFGVTLNMNK